MPELPTGTVTFLFSDIEGSTRILRQLGQAYGQLLAEHRRLMRAVVVRHGGQEVDAQGDAFFAVFRRVQDAASAAAAARTALAAHPWPGGVELRVRMGMHTSDPALSEDGYHGLGIHRAARIMASGSGGQILVSQATASVLEDNQLLGVQLRDLGERRLKDIERPEHLFELVTATSDDVSLGDGAPKPISDPETVVVSPATGRLRMDRRFIAPLVAATAALLLGGALIRKESGVSSVRAGAGLEVFDEGSGQQRRRIPLPARLDRLFYTERAVWALDRRADTAVRIDASGRRAGEIVVGNDPRAIIAVNGDIWITNRLDGTVMHFDTHAPRRSFEANVAVGEHPLGIARGFNALWVVNAGERTLARIDAATDGITARIRLGHTGWDVAAGAGAVWVANRYAASVTRVDPKTNLIAQSIRVGNGPSAIAVGHGAVWVANETDGTVSRVDPRTGTVTDTITVGNGPRALVVSPGAVWVANGLDSSAMRIDPLTRVVQRTLRLSGNPTALAAGGGALWITTTPDTQQRGGTLRVSMRAANVGPLDPAAAPRTRSWQLLSLIADGLVGYRRRPGRHGETVVPALAAAVPAPTEGGTRYTFQLRPGMRFSTGVVVTPADVRYSFERLFKLNAPGAMTYSSIIGGSSCLREPRRCDLGRGIVADMAHDRVTIRLAEADEHFVEKLALPFAAVVPRDTPLTVSDVPGSGPYRITSRMNGRLRLTRNPHFREWSRPTRPSGLPDDIVFSLYASTRGAEQRQVSEIAAERLHWATDLPPTRLGEIATRTVGQLRTTPHTRASTRLVRLTPSVPRPKPFIEYFAASVLSEDRHPLYGLLLEQLRLRR